MNKIIIILLFLNISLNAQLAKYSAYHESFTFDYGREDNVITGKDTFVFVAIGDIQMNWQGSGESWVPDYDQMKLECQCLLL